MGRDQNLENRDITAADAKKKMMIVGVLEYCSRQGLDRGGLNVTPPRQAPEGLVRGAGRLRHCRTPPPYPGLAADARQLDGEMPDGYRARRAASRARRAQRCAVEPFATLGAARLSDNNDSLTRYKYSILSNSVN